MKLLVLFLAGVVTGACLSWLCMRATLRTYKNYIRARIEQAREIRNTDSSKQASARADAQIERGGTVDTGQHPERIED